MFLDALMNALSVRTDDAKCLFTLSLLYAMVHNQGETHSGHVGSHFMSGYVLPSKLKCIWPDKFTVSLSSLPASLPPSLLLQASIPDCSKPSH